MAERATHGRLGSEQQSRYGWVVVAAITVALTFASGARLLPGVFLKPITTEFDWSRSELMATLTINMVVLSLMQPLVGLVTDRVGAKRVLLFGIVLLGVLLIPLSAADQLWHFYLLYGVLGAFALAAVSPVNVTSLVSGWFRERRGSALSIATSGSAFGQLMIVPLATWLLATTDWSNLYLSLSVVLLLVVAPVVAIFVRTAPGAAGRVDRFGGGANAEGPSWRLGQACAGSVFWFLAFGFFVCGFTMAFANAHFMAYADDMGMHATRAADIVAVTAVFSIVGSFALGLAADRYSRVWVLAITYALRGAAFVLLWFLPVNSLLFIYAVVLGVSWTATTPLTAAIAADRYGGAHLSLIFGTMFSFMNIGFGAGSFLDGLVYDAFGTYRAALLLNAALGFVAALAVLQVRGRTARRPLATPAARRPDAFITPAD